MLLRGEVDDPGRRRPLEDIWLAYPYTSIPTPLLVVAEHFRKAALELQRNTLAHHADGVHGVDKSLGAGVQQIPLHDTLDHLGPSP